VKPIEPVIVNVKFPVNPEPVSAALQTSRTPVTSWFVYVTVVVPDTSADAGTLTTAVRVARFELTSVPFGADEIAVTFVKALESSTTVAVPEGTAIGAEQRPVPTVMCIDPLIVKPNGPVTAGVADALQTST